MKLEWINHFPLDPEIMDGMKSSADMCIKSEGIPFQCAATVCLCGEDEIAEINNVHRGIASPTDVLSFPTVRYPEGLTAGHCPELLKREFDDDLSACFLGDIIISVPHILKQAAEYGHSVGREAAYLLVHGICHLMGYDHISEGDRNKMRAMEEKILSGVSLSKVQRFSEEDLELIRCAKEAMKNSYSPYSGFPVGAAIRSKRNQIFTGCNIENVSFGLTNCAERTAVFKAVSEGIREFDTIAIAGNQIPWPCGACRQVLSEFSPNIRILLCCKEEVIESSLSELLPHSIQLNKKGE